MKHVFIVGLGLMGASYAEALIQKGLTVSGYDKNQEVIKQALDDGVIHDANWSSLSKADIIILALYPNQTIEFVKENHHLFQKDQLITDISGTKTHVVKAICELLKSDVSYMSHHPMAGRARIGYQYRDKNMFIGNKCILVKTPISTEKDEQVLKTLSQMLGFKDIITVDPHTHDLLIGYTSQLTHVLAIALMHVDTPDITKHATGDSFRDLTRIANINEEMWSELFLENQDALIHSIDDMINQLERIKNIIIQNDKDGLLSLLVKAKEKRMSYDQD